MSEIWNKISMAGIILALLLLVAACSPSPSEEHDQNVMPDRTGSWSQINQTIERGSDWQQIVTDSQFQLGERSVKGYWYTGEDGTETEDYYEVVYGSYPCIDGSTVAVPMAVEFARQHLNLSDEDAAGFVVFSTTHYAYENLIASNPVGGGMIYSTTTFLEEEHLVDLIIATAPSEDELALAEEHGVELIIEPVCYDAFVFITHKDNPVDSLSLNQIRGIYSGEITNWSQVGGEDKLIEAYQREPNSGSQTAMEQLVMQGQPMLDPPLVEVITGMGALLEAVAEYQNDTTSIGYTYQYYIDTLYRDENIKTLRIDGVAAAPDTLRSLQYPLTTCYYGVIRAGDEDNNGGKFLDWMRTEAGQRCIAQAGYVTL